MALFFVTQYSSESLLLVAVSLCFFNNFSVFKHPNGEVSVSLHSLSSCIQAYTVIVTVNDNLPASLEGTQHLPLRNIRISLHRSNILEL